MIDDGLNALSEEPIKRRRFLTTTIYTLTSLILGVVSGSAGAYLFARPKEVDQNQWTDAGDLPELRPESPEEITFQRSRVDGWEVRNEKSTAWIVLNSDGTLTAFSPLCTHLGCAYEWAAQQRRFSCPCHGSTFDLTGNVISGPAPRPLDRYLVKMEGSRLWLGPVEQPQNS